MDLKELYSLPEPGQKSTGIRFWNPYYKLGEIIRLSCGCIEVVGEKGYLHYIHPDCHLDQGKQTTIPGYEYRPWYEWKALNK